MPTPVEIAPAACDGKDYGLTPQRKAEVDAQAHNLNLKLQGLETEKNGKTHLDEADQAGNAFWKQLGEVPIAERRELIKAFERENKELAKTDPALPTMTVKMDSDAFMESASLNYPMPFSMDKHHQVKTYGTMSVQYQSYGMCAEFDDKAPMPSQASQRDGFTWGQLIGGVASVFGR